VGVEVKKGGLFCPERGGGEGPIWASLSKGQEREEERDSEELTRGGGEGGRRFFLSQVQTQGSLCY